MKAVILAAGKGTRMLELTRDRPKPLLEVGKSRIVEQVLLSIKVAGIREFIIVTGYCANLIEEYFADGRSLGVDITYLRQEQIDGTGSALDMARDAAAGEPFFMCYADIITEVSNYPRIIEAFRDKPCSALVSLKWVDDPHRGAAVVLGEDDRIQRIVEKPPPGASIEISSLGILGKKLIVDNITLIKEI